LSLNIAFNLTKLKCKNGLKSVLDTMPSSASIGLENHLKQTVTTLATLVRIERRDGLVLGFTSWDADLVFESVTYKAGTLTVPTTIRSSVGTGVDNLELGGAIASDDLAADELRAGDFDDALVSVQIVNALDLTMGAITRFSGYLGDVSWNEIKFTCEARSLLQRATQTVGDICQLTCRAKLGDSTCTKSLAGTTVSGHPIKVLGATTTLVSGRKFRSTALDGIPDGHFAAGFVRWTSGANSGREMEVKASLSSTGEIELQLPMPSAIALSDNFEITAGCDGLISTCASKFNNAINFQGEPWTPGTEKTLRVIS
jgi:uncharacterized phage protein (TIGR02218 family)